MSLTIRTADLGRLNSLTKYPSIPTYHRLDPANGGLLEEPTVFTGQVIGTEKVDGTNARIIFLPDGNYILGSREELLYARGDIIGNPALGIVEALKERAERICCTVCREDAIVVFFGEVYGGKVTGASKQYTGERRVGYRLFDIARIMNFEELLGLSPEALAAWRENLHQPFFSEPELQAEAGAHGLELTPRLFTISAEELPATIEEAEAFLKEHLPKSICTLDDVAGGAAEGIVLRTTNRSVIAKARFEDYERTMRRRKSRKSVGA